MVRVDRVSDEIFVLVSDRYAQVTATVLLTSEGAIVVDALPFPSETRQILTFIEGKLGSPNVRYVINTHHHADHVNGTSLFESAEVISHDLCREILARLGEARLREAQQQVPELADVHLRLADMTLQKELYLHVGGADLHLFHTPGHTPDGISVYITGEKVLIAGDTMMPVPHIVAGNVQELQASLRRLLDISPGFVIQGHGTVLLRGEAEELLHANIAYLDTIVERVQRAVERGEPPSELRRIDIESCGLSRIPLDGLVSRLHQDNLITLYKRLQAAASEKAPSTT